MDPQPAFPFPAPQSEFAAADSTAYTPRRPEATVLYGVVASSLEPFLADTAAHLVDRVLPRVPGRQWVLTLPFCLRFRLAYDARLTSEILRLFIRVLFASDRYLWSACVVTWGKSS